MSAYKIGIVFWMILITLDTNGNTSSASTIVDTHECEKQFEKLLKTSVDCQLQLAPKVLKPISTVTKGAIKVSRCTIPLKFEKSQIYSQWIKSRSINLPKIQVQCLLVDPRQEKLLITTFVQPSCLLDQKTGWHCEINMSETKGLGLLGTLIETQVNSSQLLKDQMKHFLMSL